MAEIAWWVWLGVGLLVALTSVFSGGKLTLFAWVGLVFIVIGIAKVVSLFVLTPKEEKKVQQQRIPTPYQPQPAFYCPVCRFTVMPNDRFCKYCGARLR